MHGDVFIKRVKASKHFLRIPPAITFDVGSLKRAREAGAKSVKIIDTESGDVFQALISTIQSFGFEYNRCHGLQIALPLRDWYKGNKAINETMTFWRVIDE